MKKVFVILLTVFTVTSLSFGQNANKVLEEGKLLYRLEKASWYGTDIFLEKFAHKKDIAGGYLSYMNEKNQIVNIFFNFFVHFFLFQATVNQGQKIYFSTPES